MRAESMRDDRKNYHAESYWEDRYRSIDISKSGHIDLPIAYNRWLYRRKIERLMQRHFIPLSVSLLLREFRGVKVEKLNAARKETRK